jgi:DNA-binding CsgD family transcriptional regulator/exonuclease VII small subunit
MCEREHVIAAAARILDAARSGRGGALFVVGEAGLGKTSVLERVRELAGPDMRVRLARAHAMEGSLSFGVIDELLGAAGDPRVAGLDDPGPRQPEERASRFHAVLRRLHGGGGAVLLAVDDLHWADADSLSLLSYVCRRVTGRAVAVVGTLRPWPQAAEEMCLALAGEGHARIEQLWPLSHGAAARLLEDRAGRPLSEELVHRAWEECGGNPLLLEEVARAVRRGQYGGGGQRGASRLQQTLLLARFAGLSPAALRCARAASVLGSRFRPAIAAEVAGLEGFEAELALDALHRSGLVRQRAAVAEFAHPLLFQVVYDDITPPVRAHLHGRAFDALRRRGFSALACEHAVRADMAGDPGAIALLETTGRAELRRGATAAAIRHLQAAVQLAADRAGGGLLIALGEALLRAGRLDDAAGVYRRVADQEDLDTLSRVTSLRMLARSLLRSGDLDQALAAGASAAELAVGTDPAAAVDLTLVHACILTSLRGPEEGARVVARAAALPGSAAAATGPRVAAVRGFLALLGGDPSQVPAVDAAARSVLDTSMTEHSVDRTARELLISSARVDTCLERHDAAERTLGLALAASERAGAPGSIWRSAVCQADLLVRRGRLSEALASAERATSLVGDQPVAEAHSAVTRGAVLLQLGGPDDQVERCCAQAEAAAARNGQWFVLLQALHLRGGIRLGRREIDGACDLYARAERLGAQLGIGEPCAVPWARQAVTAYLAGGRYGDAERVLRWLEDSAERLPCRWPRIAAAVGYAALAERRRQYEQAEAWLETALNHHEEADLPLERVLTLLDWGRFLRRTGQLVRARRRLSDALRAAEDRGAGWLAAQAHEELRVAGGRRRTPRPEGLTPQEERVAQLAAAGHSNRAIADHLCLSAHTVKTHLERIYAKKGLRSRRDLMHATPPVAGAERSNAPNR